MISQKARYAFKALIALSASRPDECRQARDIATSEQIPQSFLEQILLELRRAGLVGSRRGREGGHFLLKDPADITFGHVLRLIDGPVAPLPCLSRTAYRRCHDCKDENTCAMRRGFGWAYDATLQVLEQTSIADACAGRSASDYRSVVPSATRKRPSEHKAGSQRQARNRYLTK
ncbi:MAG TPA: Rrf2 family transcriptional regulator [Xanthobacteraceae bacterium]|jgi:Rrf2 family protein|nr:Rrf2 family transcriptional regulator [Xanthobacteraceae bacterium]